jgi:hypothetical protein
MAPFAAAPMADRSLAWFALFSQSDKASRKFLDQQMQDRSDWCKVER